MAPRRTFVYPKSTSPLSIRMGNAKHALISLTRVGPRARACVRAVPCARTYARKRICTHTGPVLRFAAALCLVDTNLIPRRKSEKGINGVGHFRLS
jgi:hypothetical protein